MMPRGICGRTLHIGGVLYQWGGVGIVTGVSGSELVPLVLDRNVHISELKAGRWDVQPGRRPRGRARLEACPRYHGQSSR